MNRLQLGLATTALLIPSIALSQNLSGEFIRRDANGVVWHLMCDGNDDCSLQLSGTDQGQVAGAARLIPNEDPQDTFHFTLSWDSKCSDCRNTIIFLRLMDWSGRSYLLGTSNFCNELNAGLEPRDGPYGATFLKVGDWEIEPETDHPVEYDCLLPDSFEGTILSVNGIGVDIKVNNSDFKIKSEMALYQTSPSCLKLTVRGDQLARDRVFAVSEEPDTASIGSPVFGRPCQ